MREMTGIETSRKREEADLVAENSNPDPDLRNEGVKSKDQEADLETEVGPETETGGREAEVDLLKGDEETEVDPAPVTGGDDNFNE